MMKLKLEPKFFPTQYFKEEVFNKRLGQAKAIISQCLLTPHLKLNLSTQVPTKNSVNSKGFFNTNQSNVSIGKYTLLFPRLSEKSLDFSGKKKALLMFVYILFSQESSCIISAFQHLFNRGSRLGSSTLINPN